MSAATKWVLPPADRKLDDLVREYGRDRARAKLVSGQWTAFWCNRNTGDLKQIPAIIWDEARGRTWLQGGASGIEPLPGGVFGMISYTIIVREQQPPRMYNSKDADGPKVRLAKKLMDAVFPQREWRRMGVRAVRKDCEQEAEKRQVELPSSDSFSRAMNRRRK